MKPLSVARIAKKAGMPIIRIKGVEGYTIKVWPHDHAQGTEACLWCKIQKTVLREHGKVGYRFLSNLVTRQKRDVADRRRMEILLRSSLAAKRES